MIRALLGAGFLFLAFIELLDYKSGIQYQSVTSFSGAVAVAAGWGFWLLLPFLKRITVWFLGMRKAEVDNER